MSKIDEKKIINIFQKSFGNSKFVSEDVETINFGKTQFVIATDTLVQSTDVPKNMKIEFAVRKSVVACVSDFASKGVLPKFGIVSLTIPKSFTKKHIQKIASSLANSAREFKIRFIGGDTNQGKELVIQVTLIGFSRSIIKRRGAKIGDSIFVTGPFGHTSSGLKILLEKKKSSLKYSKKAKNAVFNPNVHLDFAIKGAKYFSSAMDSSDGLAATLHEMSRQSRKKFVLKKIPAEKDVFDFAKENKLGPMNLIFNGGEEYEIVFTTKYKKNILEIAKKHGVNLYEIGSVSNGSGVIYENQEKRTVIEDIGWVHLK